MIFVIEIHPLTKRVLLHDDWAYVVALLCHFITTDDVIELSIHNQRPVHRVQVTELRILFNPQCSTGDVLQVVQANVLQAGHLVDHQRIVVEEIAPTDDTQVGEEDAEAIQAWDTKQQQVVGDDGQFGKAEGAEGVLMEIVGLVID